MQVIKSNNQFSSNKSLIEKLTLIVIDNLQNEQFGVSELAQLAGISRSHLHRKLFLISEQSVSQFIREIRLKEAYKLLKSEDLTASEVAYKVGFNNPSYFSRCFHDFYGFPPGQAKNKITGKPGIKNIGEEKPERDDNKVLSIAFKAKSTKEVIRRMPSWIPYALLAVAVVGIVLVSINLFWVDKRFEAEPFESVLVLPFGNFTGDNGLEYFVSGMHSSLIGDLGRLSGLRVISKTSSEAYKNVDISLKDLAKELNVDAVVETSVMCLGDSICVQFNLVAVYPEEKQIWVGNFKEEKSQILNLYSKATKQIAEEIKVKLTPLEEDLLSELSPVDTGAYNAYMRGLYYLDKYNKSSLDSAEKYFNIAREKNPDGSLPYGGLAQVWMYKHQVGFVPRSLSIPKIYNYLNIALEMDPNSSNSHYMKAITAVWMEWNWEKGEKEFKKSLELNPNHALCRVFYAHFLMIMHRNDEALLQANQALELDPLRPMILALYAKVLINEGDYEGAKGPVEKAVTIDSDHKMVISSVNQFLYVTGNYERWFQFWKTNYIGTNKDYGMFMEKTFHEKGHLAVINEFINRIEEKDKKGGQISYTGLARLYLKTKNYEKAIDCLYKAYEARNTNLPYASTRRYDSHILKEYPRYVELMRKMRLPVE